MQPKQPESDSTIDLDTLLKQYRQDDFPKELLEQGWTADAADWNPPAHLRAKVMQSYDRSQREKLWYQWKRLVLAKVRLPLPLAVTTAGLVITLSTWSVLREPTVVVINTSHTVPGPALVTPVQDNSMVEPVKIPKPNQMEPSTKLNRLPVLRGGNANPPALAGKLEFVRLAPGRLRMFADDIEVAVSTDPNASGTAFWVQAGGVGGFIVTLYSPKPGVKPIGILEGRNLRFNYEATEYRIECERSLITESKSFALWVQYQKTVLAGTPFALGCSENVTDALERLQQN